MNRSTQFNVLARALEDALERLGLRPEEGERAKSLAAESEKVAELIRCNGVLQAALLCDRAARKRVDERRKKRSEDERPRLIGLALSAVEKVSGRKLSVTTLRAADHGERRWLDGLALEAATILTRLLLIRGVKPREAFAARVWNDYVLSDKQRAVAIHLPGQLLRHPLACVVLFHRARLARGERGEDSDGGRLALAVLADKVVKAGAGVDLLAAPLRSILDVDDRGPYLAAVTLRAATELKETVEAVETALPLLREGSRP